MQGTWMYNKDTGDVSVLALVVCSTRLIAAIVAVGDLVSAHEDCRWLSHMVFFQGKLCALDGNTDPEDLIAIDIVDDDDCHEPRVSRIERLIVGASLPPQNYIFWEDYLLESHGTLLMIRRKLYYKAEHPSERRHGGIFAYFEEGLWSEVRTLGNDQALFLGRGCSRAIHVSPYDLSRDCLFFLDDYTDWIWKKTTTSCGVYDMKDEKVYSALPMVSWKSGDQNQIICPRLGIIFFEGQTLNNCRFFPICETHKLQAAGEHLQEIVGPEQDDPQMLDYGGTCAAGASTAQRNC
ncbi:hypothetical protein PVAP13_8KG126320 [Panicum virgatum]|uniref:KIB1-4 beta-propeller domain-containing protein n=1 Tax=Panicum virgatum TaxID=38727 RepID=A0A8T0PC03_PANVG|nr:hypothetical protein PVAP13_8KG126320 [Panicum virgatum]